MIKIEKESGKKLLGLKMRKRKKTMILAVYFIDCFYGSKMCEHAKIYPILFDLPK